MNIKGIKANSILFRLGGVVTHFVLFCDFFNVHKFSEKTSHFIQF